MNTGRIGCCLLLALSLAGCAGQQVSRQQQDGAVADVRARLGMGQCDAALAAQVRALGDSAVLLEAAYQCLTMAQLDTAQSLLDSYQAQQGGSEGDYAAYLAALIPYARFELAAGDSQLQVQLGREAHAALTGFVRSYPQSGYRAEMVPRVQAVLEGMARAEYDLAVLDQERGQLERARARMRYLQNGYPRSAAAADATAWLLDHQG
ncbi:MAG: outer membrane protein assembly factor BamD [Pseudomonadaceae bacterium]